MDKTFHFMAWLACIPGYEFWINIVNKFWMFFLPLGLEIVPGRLIIKHPPKKNFSEKKNICKKKRIG